MEIPHKFSRFLKSDQSAPEEKPVTSFIYIGRVKPFVSILSSITFIIPVTALVLLIIFIFIYALSKVVFFIILGIVLCIILVVLTYPYYRIISFYLPESNEPSVYTKLFASICTIDIVQKQVIFNTIKYSFAQTNGFFLKLNKNKEKQWNDLFLIISKESDVDIIHICKWEVGKDFVGEMGEIDDYLNKCIGKLNFNPNDIRNELQQIYPTLLESKPLKSNVSTSNSVVEKSVEKKEYFQPVGIVIDMPDFLQNKSEFTFDSSKEISTSRENKSYLEYLQGLNQPQLPKKRTFENTFTPPVASNQYFSYNI